MSRSGSSSPSSSSSSPNNKMSSQPMTGRDFSTNSTTPSTTNTASLSIQAPLAHSTNSTQSLGLVGGESVKPPPPTGASTALVTTLSSSPPQQSANATQNTAPFPVSARQIRKITLKKGPTGFGIAISEDRYSRLIVRGLNPNGVAFHDGRMQIGDEILAVNEQYVSQMKYDDVMQLLHTTMEPVEFQVTKAEVLTTTTTTTTNTTTASSSVPSACDSSEPSRVGSPSVVVKSKLVASPDQQRLKSDQLDSGDKSTTKGILKDFNHI